MLNNIKILSLPKSIKRQKFMDYKLQQLSINNYDYFPAINGKESSEYINYENFCKKNHIKILTGEQGAYGCLMSYKKLFKQQTKSVLILEDDVYFHKNFLTVSSELPYHKFDLIYFGYNNYRLSSEQKESIDNNSVFLPVSSDRKFITCGTYAIWYSMRAVNLLNKLLEELSYREIKPIDHIVWYAASQLKSVIINPPLCISEVRDSNIRPARDTVGFYRQRGVRLEDYMHLDEYENFI